MIIDRRTIVGAVAAVALASTSACAGDPPRRAQLSAAETTSSIKSPTATPPPRPPDSLPAESSETLRLLVSPSVLPQSGGQLEIVMDVASGSHLTLGAGIRVDRLQGDRWTFFGRLSGGATNEGGLHVGGDPPGRDGNLAAYPVTAVPVHFKWPATEAGWYRLEQGAAGQGKEVLFVGYLQVE